MGELFRSEAMYKCQLFLQTESAFSYIAELGELGKIQFIDHNVHQTSFQRNYVEEVRRCIEMQRSLRFLEQEIRKEDIPIFEPEEIPKAPHPKEMAKLEDTFQTREQEMLKVNGNEGTLRREWLQLKELQIVLDNTQTIFDEKEDVRAYETVWETSRDRRVSSQSAKSAEDGVSSFSNPAMEMPVVDTTAGNVSGGVQLRSQKSDLNFVTGLLVRERMAGFEKLLWRVGRGNVFLKFVPLDETLEDPAMRNEVQKTYFIIFFEGEQLKGRVKKICDGFRASLYACPETAQERQSMSEKLANDIEEMKKVLAQTQAVRHQLVVNNAQNIRAWFFKIHKMKAIYHILNHVSVDVSKHWLIADCWCPERDLEAIQEALKRAAAIAQEEPPILQRLDTHEAPPTYFRLNKFTKGFQKIVDAYGVATYREVNPAPFTVISFPFLFAIMFGDIGHGIFLTLFAAILVYKEKAIKKARVKDEIFRNFFSGRYIILLMGLFSIYTGSIYNDIFSRSINLFGTGWKIPKFMNGTGHPDSVILDPIVSAHHPYPFGMDPVWQLAPENKLVFLNSFKMKMSIIIGVFQMIFGVVLSLFNHIYFKKTINIVCLFIPQLIFLCSLFLYLCVEIFIKWTHFGVRPIPGRYPGSFCSPQLLIGFINMFMFADLPMMDENSATNPACSGFHWYRGQYYVQSFLCVLAILCIPWMLVVKPVILQQRHRNKHMSEAATAELQIGSEQEFCFSETFILQAIHTIEFCLGCISHTASYLRLWALSLAHAELSDVLWSMVMSEGFVMINGYAAIPAIYVTFAVFATLTVGILIVMEGLSAFLHALRLHWVEFNSKFYTGEGYAFLPFSFAKILKEIEDGA